MLDRTKDWQEYSGATLNVAVTTIVALGALYNPPSSHSLVLVRYIEGNARASGAASALLVEIRRAKTIAGGALLRGGLPTLSPSAGDGPKSRSSSARIYGTSASNGGAATPITYADLDTDPLLDQFDVGGAYTESKVAFNLRGGVLSPGEGYVMRATSGSSVSPSMRATWIEIPEDTVDVRRAIEHFRSVGML